MLVQIVCTWAGLHVLSQIVMSYPVKVKYDTSGRDADAKDSWNVLDSLNTHNLHLPPEVSKLRMLPVEGFLRENSADILRRTEQRAPGMPAGKLRVSKVRSKKRLSEHSQASLTHTEQGLPVHLQISPVQKLDRQPVREKGQTGTGPDRPGENRLLPPLHHRGTDFLKSLPDPAVNHGSFPPNLSVHGEQLKARPASKPESGFAYEAKTEENTNGVAKAEALAANPQAASPSRTTSTMILVISSTVVVLLVTCVTVSIFQCCCRKKRNAEELQPSAEETKEEVDNTALLRSRNSVHDTPTYRPLSINSTGDGLDMEEVPQLSVRDKIKAFEGQSKSDQENKTSTPEHGKPVRKRPKSKAFEEFENQGIIIGMGMVKTRPKSTTEPDFDTSTEPGLLNEIMASMSSDYNNITMLSDASDKITQNGSPISPDTEMSSSYLDEDLDEFSGIERNTHILRSFKRAPPPKNRSRSKRSSRSSRRRLPLQDTTNLSTDTPDEPNGIPENCDVKVHDVEKEQSPTDTSVQRGLKEFGSPSIHSSESRTDIDRVESPDTSANGNRSVINGHTPSSSINGHSQKGEGSRRKNDREATPPDKTSANGNREISKAPPDIKMYENPCYESIDVIQASINRVSTTEKAFNGKRKSPDKSEPSRIPRVVDRRTTPPRGEPHRSPSRGEERIPRQTPQSRVSPESHRSPERRDHRVSPERRDHRVSPERRDHRVSPERRDHGVSPPKNGSRISPSRSDKRQSWKESPSNNPEDWKPVKQTHL